MSTLMVSISGIRGIVGESLTPAVVIKYALAFGQSKKGSTIIVGGDSRTSGKSYEIGISARPGDVDLVCEDGSGPVHRPQRHGHSSDSSQ